MLNPDRTVTTRRTIEQLASLRMKHEKEKTICLNMLFRSLGGKFCKLCNLNVREECQHFLGNVDTQ